MDFMMTVALKRQGITRKRRPAWQLQSAGEAGEGNLLCCTIHQLQHYVGPNMIHVMEIEHWSCVRALFHI